MKVMRLVFKLRDFDDFLSCAKCCDQVFFMKEVKGGRIRITAYAGRVWWEGYFENEGEDLRRRGIIEEELEELHSKEVLEDTELELIFR
jgi:hypothetical protein